MAAFSYVVVVLRDMAVMATFRERIMMQRLPSRNNDHGSINGSILGIENV